MNQPMYPAFLAAMEQNPLHKAANDYQLMETQRDASVAKANELATINAGLVAEVGIIREQMQNSERERKRAQAVASTFAGQARSLAAILNDIMSLAIKNGIEAADKADPALEQAGKEAQAVLQRVEPIVPSKPPASPIAAPRAPVALGGPAMPAVDWSRLPQGVLAVSNGDQGSAA